MMCRLLICMVEPTMHGKYMEGGGVSNQEGYDIMLP